MNPFDPLIAAIDRRADQLPEQQRAALAVALDAGRPVAVLFDATTATTAAHLDGERLWTAPMVPDEIAATGETLCEALDSARHAPGGDELPGMVDAGARLSLLLTLAPASIRVGVMVHQHDGPPREIAAAIWTPSVH